jgi:uncharacterized protein YifE (UPF0438 family)
MAHAKSEAHKAKLREPFTPACNTQVFSEAELELLERYGAWLGALMRGEIEPESERQRRFLLVCNGEIPPSGEVQKVWCKYLYRMQWEKANKEYMGTEQKADWGFNGAPWLSPSRRVGDE